MICPTGPACPPGGMSWGATPAPMPCPVYPGMPGPMAGPMSGPMAGPMSGPMAGHMLGPMAGPMPGPVPPGPMYPPIGPEGVLNMDIGPDPGLVNMDMGGAHVYGMEAGVHECVPQRIHVVLACDTIWSISQLYNVDMDIIIQVNHLTDPNKIYVGQRLVIPGGLTFNIA